MLNVVPAGLRACGCARTVGAPEVGPPAGGVAAGARRLAAEDPEGEAQGVKAVPKTQKRLCLQCHGTKACWQGDGRVVCLSFGWCLHCWCLGVSGLGRGICAAVSVVLHMAEGRCRAACVRV